MTTASRTRRPLPPVASQKNAPPRREGRPSNLRPPLNGDVADTPLFDFSKEPGYYHATAKKAILRRAKRPPYDELVIDFAGSAVQIELRAAGNLLLAGSWDWSARASGTELTAAGDWKEVAWHREPTCDYLEIELPLSRDYKLERQMFFARQDLFFFVADCLVGPANDAHELHYAQTLPLASGTTFGIADETWEGWFAAGGRRRAGVVPLGQPEWRADFRHSRLNAGKDKLTAEQAVQGRRLLAPLWIDIHPQRVRRPITWRQLTVGENLTAVSRDVAAAYRIQSGDEQWFIYRSLGPVANRSVMGHNTFGSFVCGRIRPDGSVREILTME